MSPTNTITTADSSTDCAEQAGELLALRYLGKWTDEDQIEFERRVEQEPAFAAAVRRIERSYHSVGKHAASAELMAFREQALARTRRASARRWGGAGFTSRAWRMAATMAGVGVVLGIALELSPFAYRPGSFETRIGEQRTIGLSDHSHITLDSKTRLRVTFSEDARVVRLLDGQAQFSVAKDPGRPFKVEAGDRTVVAIGTNFTVEYVDREMRVAMLEGVVAVLRPVERQASPVELIAGDELRVRRDGRATVTPKSDIGAATAWRQGKVIFRNESLGDAIRRVNRYSTVQVGLEDAALAGLKVSGVFEAGNSREFAEALQGYLPLSADYSDPQTIWLKSR